jgi:hypothetical protein
VDTGGMTTESFCRQTAGSSDEKGADLLTADRPISGTFTISD